MYTRYPIVARALGLAFRPSLYARYLCSRDALGRPSAARDDRVSCIQRPSARASKGVLHTRVRYVPRLNKIANVLAIRQVKQIGGVPKFRNLANLSKISISIFSRPL